MSETPEDQVTSADDISSQSATQPVPESSPHEITSSTEQTTSTSKPAASGPISLDKIRQMRLEQQRAEAARKQANRPPKKSKPNPVAGSEGPRTGEEEAGADDSNPRRMEVGRIKTPQTTNGPAPKVAVPSRRQPLSQDLEEELNAVLGGGDLDKMLVGGEELRVGITLEEGQRAQATVLKLHNDLVFVTMGGANEGFIPLLQFENAPEIGATFDVVVRGYVSDEGLYELTVPGNAIDVSDWDDIKEGEVVEGVVTAANTGGLEVKVGNIRGFIPASQVAEYRIENFGEFVGEKVLCVITECNPRRGNLVLSRRAVLEREKKEKRAERLASIAVGDAVEGIVRKIMDFGAFVDIGGLDGLLHVSQLSWERVSHPKEVLEEGQKIQVRIDKIDDQTGKIGLSYRSLQDHPWKEIDSRFPIGAVVQGTVTRIADFGAFVRIATGVEGLVHLSELAHHRVARVENVVSEGQDVTVKILSMDVDKQRISLSIKAAVAAPENTQVDNEPEVEEAPAKPVLPKHRGPLKGGTTKSSGGEQFGLKW